MKKLTRSLLPALLLLPAAGGLQAGDKAAHGLARLYQAAAQRDAGADIRAHKSHAQAPARTVTLPAPVQAVMRARPVQGGGYEILCTTEHAGPRGAGAGLELPLTGNGRVER